MAGSLQKYRTQLAARGRQIAEMRNSTVPSALASGAVVDGAAFAGGFADEYIGDVGGIEPSVAAGIAAAVGGVTMRHPRMIQVASGLLADAARQAGKQAAQAVAAKTSK